MKNPCECSCCTSSSLSSLCFTRSRGTFDARDCTPEQCSSRFPDECPRHPHPGITTATSVGGFERSYNPALSGAFNRAFGDVIVFNLVAIWGGIFIFIYGLFLAIYCLATKKWWEGGRKWTWGIFGILVVVYLVVLLVLGLKAARPPTEDSQKSE